jgi:two-component system, NtrC family, nitrogen regulation sensor histidine kinase NtrY
MSAGAPWRDAALIAAGALPLLAVALAAALDAALPRPALSLLLWLALLWLAACLVLTWRRLTGRLQQLTRLVQGLRAGDHTLRSRSGGLFTGALQQELHALSRHLGGEARRSLETDALLSQLLAALDLAVLIVDADDRLVDMNPHAETVLGGATDALLGRTAAQLGFSAWLTRPAPFIDRDAGGAAPAGGPWEVRRLVFRRRGRPHRLLVVTDASRALREQERLAWRRLIRVLGHEINNSLGSSQSTAGLLRERGSGTDPTLQEGLELIERRSRALGGFIRRYAELARLPPPAPEALRVDELIRHVSSLEERVPVTVEPGMPVTLQADPAQLEQALINLLRNAADAALQTGGGVRVRWRREERLLTLEVEDDGPGLSQTDNLFVPFFTTKPGGSGIGLALASQIIEAHGGGLRLTNRPHGRGAMAAVRLPA